MFHNRAEGFVVLVRGIRPHVAAASFHMTDDVAARARRTSTDLHKFQEISVRRASRSAVAAKRWRS